MKKLMVMVVGLVAVSAYCEDMQMQRAKLELLVEQAEEMLTEANRKGSATHSAPYQYYFGMMYATGTNLLARAESQKTTQLIQQYMKLIEKNYEAYTKIEKAEAMAAATGSDQVHVGRRVVKNGSRHRAKRLANVEKLCEKELTNAIQQWERFAIQLKKSK